MNHEQEWKRPVLIRIFCAGNSHAITVKESLEKNNDWYCLSICSILWHNYGLSMCHEITVLIIKVIMNVVLAI